MQKAHIKPGIEYALREKRADPLQRIKIIAHIRGTKWRAEWIEPNPGLIHFVESGHLIASWKEHKAFLKEEEHEQRIDEYNQRQGYRKDSAVDRALYEVFESVGDDVSYYDGCLSAKPEAFERLLTRCELPTDQHSAYAYTARDGDLILPYDEALTIARKFCAVEPSTVLVRAEATEREWSTKAAHGEDYIIKLLNEYRAAWALVRQWAGHDAAIAAREAQIQRLERLVWDAVYALQKAGLDSEAAKLRRAVERH
jgi:hypothetical protein